MIHDLKSEQNPETLLKNNDKVFELLFFVILL